MAVKTGANHVQTSKHFSVIVAVSITLEVVIAQRILAIDIASHALRIMCITVKDVMLIMMVAVMPTMMMRMTAD